MTPSQRAAAEVLARRKAKREAIISSCHGKQQEVLRSKARYKAVLAGRRGGKSKMDAAAIAVSLEESNADDWTFYSAVTRVVAKDLIFPKLEEINRDHGLGWNMKAHEGVIVTPRGGMFRVLGFDDSGQIEKSAGYRVRLFVCDEPHSYATKLKYLAEQKIGPSLGDLGGTLMLTGTPGIARTGYWFDATNAKLPEYTKWHWTVRDNPLFPRDPEQWIAEELALRKWTVETPAFRREILAEWCDDEGMMCYPYVADRNKSGRLDLDPAGLFTLAMDYGVVNATAASVWYSPPQTRKAWCIYSRKKTGILPDEATAWTAELWERFHRPRMVGDAGGLGKTYVETWNRRYGSNAGMFMRSADKVGKRAHMKVLADAYRMGDAFVVEEDCQDLVDEYADLVWEDESQEKEDPTCDNDAADSALYGFTDHASYWADIPKPPPKDDELERLAQAERIRRVQEARQRAREEDYEW